MPAEIVTVIDFIDAGLRLGLSFRRTAALYRESGGRRSTAELLGLWKERRATMERLDLLPGPRL